MKTHSDFFIKQTSIQLNQPEWVVDEVIRHQWKSVHENLPLHASIEISGLVKFKLRPNQINKRIKILSEMKEAYEKQLSNPNLEKRSSVEKRLESAVTELEYLKEKLKQHENTL